MSEKIPIMLVKSVICDETNNLTPNIAGTRVSYIVLMTDRLAVTTVNLNDVYDNRCGHFAITPTTLAYNQSFIFDEDDAATAKRKAFMKMQELWASIEF